MKEETLKKPRVTQSPPQRYCDVCGFGVSGFVKKEELPPYTRCSSCHQIYII